MKKDSFKVCGVVIAAVILLSLVTTAWFFTPVQKLAPDAGRMLVNLAGKAITTEDAPIWRLCALDGIGPSRAQEIVEQREK